MQVARGQAGYVEVYLIEGVVQIDKRNFDVLIDCPKSRLSVFRGYET
jgi:hypothetical protein